jgi:hypothetical protein
VTGRGSPLANLVVAGLVGQSAPATVTHFSVTAASSSTAGSPLGVTVTALDANGNPFPGYTGTVHFTSSDSLAGLPADYTFTSGDNGAHTFSVTLDTAGSQSITVKDMANSSMSGSAAVTVNPAAASKLVFGQQPTNAVVGSAISPAVTVRVVDAYGNLLSGDNTDQVTLSLGSNPAGAALGGTLTATVNGGVATFSNLTLNNAGTGYTLRASSGNLSGATSASFNVTSNSSKVIEGFETSSSWYTVGASSPTAYLSTAAAHDGTYGLDDYSGSDWIYRNDAGSQVKAGDTLSVWLRFSGTADGRAYFGFGASASGTLSLVAAPNTNQLLLQQNTNYGYVNLAAVNQTFQANHWYRLEVDWGTSGKIVGRLYDSHGTTLLRTVTATTTAITSGGIAFRATGHDKFWDTVTDTPGVNSFATPATASASAPAVTGAASSAPNSKSVAGRQPSAVETLLTLAASPSQAVTPDASQRLMAAVDHYFTSQEAAMGYRPNVKAGTATPWLDAVE